MKQRVPVRLAVGVQRTLVQHLMEAGAELVHRCQQVFITLDPADMVRPRTPFERKLRLLPADVGDGLVGGAWLPAGDAAEYLALMDRPGAGQHAVAHSRL